MTSFVESCLETVAGSAGAVERRSRRHPRAHRLLRLLAEKKHILLTTHLHPDPDALASCLGLCKLLRSKLKDVKVSISVKGLLGGGLNRVFLEEADLSATPWDDAALTSYDAIVLLDVQPGSSYSPLPAGVEPLAVIDHHRLRGRKTLCPFCDIRTDVGATASIVFSYFMEMEVEIDADLGASMLFAIETDLAGAAGQPGDLDNVALSSLTLIANTHKLHKMRHVDLPQSYFVAYAAGLNNAMWYDTVMTSFLGPITSPEQPAVAADFLLRFDQAQWVLVTGLSGQSLVLSLRTKSMRQSAADVMRRLIRNIGEGGGHKTKAGGLIRLSTGSASEIDRLRNILRRRFLRTMRISAARGQRLVGKES